ncbi:MAG: ribonucleotide-diphosphate reductase subunit beta [Actinomycetota bacterium]
MTDIDVARDVEAADLKSMEKMDVDNVYVLMDVQLRERPGPRVLYDRWEKQNWAVGDLDFQAKDVEDWKNIPDMLKNEIIYGLQAFYMGEVCVTETLSPMVHAAPTTADQQFLATQLVDEARHAIFFEEFFRQVLGIDGIDALKADPMFSDYLSPDVPGYGRVFFQDLPNVTEAVREDPADYKKWVTSIVLYHMLIEGMLALYGQRQLLQATRAFDVLPAFRAGFTAVTRDESRHVNYGVYALRKAYEAGLHDHIVQSASDYMDGCCDLLTRTLTKIELPPEEFLAMVPEEMQSGFFTEWEFPTVQLRKRLGGAGISSEAIDKLDLQWFTQIDRNINEYAERFDEEHPAISRDPEGYAKLQSKIGAAV